MITEKNGNLLEANDIDVAIHQSNLFHTFGAGIALQIKNKYPEAFEADLATQYGDKNKLGTYSYAFIQKANIYIVNVYSQDGFAQPNKPATDYEAFKKALIKIKNDFADKIIGIPYGIGCGLAGGDWVKVYQIIESVFGNSGHCIIYKFQPK